MRAYMNPMFDFKRNSWMWQVTVLSVVLGMLLAAALKTQQSVKLASGIPTTRISGLTQLLLDEREQKKVLQTKISDLQAKVDRYERAVGQGGTQSQILKDELYKAKLLAGLLPAKGPGVEVVLRDSPKPVPKDLESVLRPEWIIHDSDLRDFVNELSANGAEAVAISDKDSTQRIIANTPIRCDAGVIRVNRVPMSSPFTVTAIGPPNALKSALEMPNGLISQFRFTAGLTSSMVRVKAGADLYLPSYSGTTSFIYATTAESEEAPK